jgi:hypothetical protein
MQSLCIHASNPNTLFAFGGETAADGSETGNGAFLCSNCGLTPTWKYIGATHSGHHAIAWAGNLLIDGNDGGVWSTADSGNTWVDLNATISILSDSAKHFTGHLCFEITARKQARQTKPSAPPESTALVAVAQAVSPASSEYFSASRTPLQLKVPSDSYTRGSGRARISR